MQKIIVLDTYRLMSPTLCRLKTYDKSFILTIFLPPMPKGLVFLESKQLMSPPNC